MGCVINKVVLENGENSQLFEVLSGIMPPSLALENYLELTTNKDKYKEIYGENEQGEIDGTKFISTPKYKLVEFDTYQQQLDVFDVLTDAFLDELKKAEKTSSSTTLSKINLRGLTNDPLVIPRIVQNIKNNFSNEIASNNYPKAKADMLMAGAERLNSYIGEANMLGPIGMRLMDYGIYIDVGKEPIAYEQIEKELEDQNIDTDNARIEYERIYSMSILETSPSNSVLDQLKIYLRGIKKVSNTYKFNPNNPGYIDYEISEAGSPRPSRYDVLISSLYSTLVGAQSISDVHTRIARAVQTQPQLAPIYKDLINEKSVNIDRVGAYKPLSTALFSLAKQNYNMVSFVEMINGKVVLMDANSDTTSKLKVNLWNNNATKVRDADNSKLLEKVNTYLDSSKVTQALNQKKTQNKVSSYVPQGSALGAASRLLEASGFTGITKEVLRSLVDRVQQNPLLLHKSNNIVTPASTIQSVVKALAKNTLEGKDVFPSGPTIGESKTLRLLSSIVGETSSEVNIGSFLGGNNTIIHPFNFGSEAQDIFSRIKGSSKENIEYFQTLAEDDMYIDTQIVKILTDDTGQDSGMFESHTLDTLKNNAANSGAGYGSWSTFDALISRMNSYFHPKTNGNYFQAFGPTQGDRGNLELVTVPKMNLKSDSTDGTIAGGIFNDAGQVVAPEIKNWIGNQIKAELKRILKVKGLKNIPNYSENGLRFNLFTSLNESFNLEALSEKSINKTILELLPIAEQQFHDSIKEDAQYYVDNGVLEKSGVNFKQTNNSKSSFSEKVGDKRGEIKPSEMDTFLANNFIYNYELTLFRIGDPAFYKAGTDAAQKVDMNKRFALPFTPGTKLAVGEGTGMPEKFKVKILKEGEFESEVAEVLQTISGTKAFGNIELADGAGWVSIDRYRRTALAQGQHTDELLDLLKKHEDWQQGDPMPTSEETTKVLKAFFFGLQDIDGVFGPFSLKYGIMPALPAFFEQMSGNRYKYPTMAAVSKDLREGRSDEVVMESAVKVGKRNMVTADNLADSPAIELPNASVRHPQVTTSKIKTEELYGSQMRKLIISNFDPTGEFRRGGEVISAQEALNDYNRAIANIVSEGGSSVYNQFVTKFETANIPNLVSELLDKSNASPSQNTEYYQSALQTFGDDGLSTLPLYYPTLKSRVDNMVNSMFRRKVNRFKLPGHSAVQVSSYGMTADKNNGELGVGSDLKFTTFAHPDGTRVSNAEAVRLAKLTKKTDEKSKAELAKYIAAPAEVRVTPNFFIGNIKKIAQKTATKDQSVYSDARAFSKKYGKTEAERAKLYKNKRDRLIQGKLEAEVKRLTSLITNDDNSYNLTEIRKAGLDEIVLYRIPTQGKNSMLYAKIKEFLPPTSGNTIQVPAEIVDQAGSDFDIDKVYIEMSSFKEAGKDNPNAFEKTPYLRDDNTVDVSTKEKAQAYIVDFHKQVLSAPQHIAELVSPNGVATLKKLVKGLGVSEESITGLIGSVKLQETFRNNNKSGKDLISISSISSVMHSVAQHIGAHFIDKKLTLKGVNPEGDANRIHLGSKMNIQGTALISTEISEIQNAALDNAKEPLLGLLNIDNFTASTALFLVNAGHGLKFATDVLNAPIIKDLARVYPKYARLHSPEAAKKKAFSEVRRKYKLRGNQGNKLFSMGTFSAAQAEKLLNPKTQDDHAVSLKAFEELQKLGESLAKFQRTMNIDAKGVPPSVSKLFDTYVDMSDIQGTKAYIQERGKEPLLAPYSRGKILRRANPVGVETDAYSNSHLSAMEVNTLHKPLKANIVITPSASKLMQQVLFEAKEMIGYIPENLQLNILSSFDTYLATNTMASEASTSSISSDIQNGDFLYLTDKLDTKATANLLDSYRDYVNKFKLTENQFTEKLKITEKDGRRYVSFNNLTSRALSGEVKADMMHFFEELMYSENPVERSLAESLANYALVNYGFSTSKNSFMQYIPPQAHKEFMKGKGEGVNLPTHFRTLSTTYNKSGVDKLSSDGIIKDFVESYIQNNAHKMPLESFFEAVPGQYTISMGDKMHWRDQIQERMAQNDRYTPPNYIKVFNPTGEFNLYKFENGGYVNLERRGVPNVVVEYHAGPSHFNNTKSSVEMDSTQEKNKASEENLTALHIIKRDSLSYADVTTKVTGLNKVRNADNAQEFVNRIARELDLEVGLGSNDINSMREVLKGVIQGTDIVYKHKKRKGKLAGETFNSIFAKKYEDASQNVLNEAFRHIINNLC